MVLFYVQPIWIIESRRVIWAGRCTSSLSSMVPLPTFRGVGYVHSFFHNLLLSFQFFIFNILHINKAFYSTKKIERTNQQTFPFLENIDINKLVIPIGWLSDSSSISLHLIFQFIIYQNSKKKHGRKGKQNKRKKKKIWETISQLVLSKFNVSHLNRVLYCKVFKGILWFFFQAVWFKCD